ncbi:hypothetical protein AB1Y63_12650, partial [Morganella morganii]|uniref:hypothetical protein n=1 Tax=Morganella morganii TaxID=582 RepID=UPI00345BDF58
MKISTNIPSIKSLCLLAHNYSQQILLYSTYENCPFKSEIVQITSRRAGRPPARLCFIPLLLPALHA